MKPFWGMAPRSVHTNPETAVVSEDMRVRIAHTIAAVERQQHLLAAQLAGRMNSPEPSEGSADTHVVAALLLRLLIDGGSDIAAFGGLRELSGVGQKHVGLGVDGRHYSRFGVALSPVMQSVLGITMPPATLDAWVDVYWLVVRAVGRDETARVLSHSPADRNLGRLH